MCGIVGYISLDDKCHPLAKRHFADYALMLDTLRGSDSTGIIRVNKEFDVHTAHTTMAGRKYVHTAEYEEFMDAFDGWAFIGHNRAATAGSVKLENAHPFTFGDVTMVHNGTLTNQGRGMPGYDHKLEVDSMQIARALSEIAPDQKEVADLLSKIDGSFALVWVDRRDSSINMCRNSSRPIHFGYGDANDIMWFMSDGTHLKSVVGSLGKAPSRVNTIYSLDKMRLLKFKKGNMVPEVTKFDPFVRPVTNPPVVHTATTTRSVIGSALRRGADKWAATVGGYSRVSAKPSTGGTEPGKYNVGGHQRKIPANHVKALKELYQLDTDVLLEFTPDEWIEVDDKKCVVSGTFLHPGWMWTEWPATLYDVPLVVCTAYGEQDWAVKAKGVTGCTQMRMHGDVCGVLAELYCVDAKTVMNTQSHACDEEKEKDEDTGLVSGPEDSLVKRGKMMELLKDGCVQCGADIQWEERTLTTIVNDGRNVLCPTCTKEWKEVA